MEDLFLDELEDFYDGQRQLVKALPQMQMAALSTRLRQQIGRQAGVEQCHLAKLEHVFQCLGQVPQGKVCRAMSALLRESQDLSHEFRGTGPIDAGLCLILHKVARQKAVACETLAKWAHALEYAEATRFLGQILENESCELEADVTQKQFRVGNEWRSTFEKPSYPAGTELTFVEFSPSVPNL